MAALASMATEHSGSIRVGRGGESDQLNKYQITDKVSGPWK